MFYLQNDTEPSFAYYYQNKKHIEESFFIYNHDLEEDSCFSEDFDCAYPTGTLLCKCLNIISGICYLIDECKNDVKINLSLQIPKIINDFLPEGKDRNTSLDELRLFLESDLYQNKASCFDYTGEKFCQILNCYRYIELCTQDKLYSSPENLINFASLNKLRIKSSFKSLNGFPPKEIDGPITIWQIKQYLDILHKNKIISENMNDDSNQQIYVDLFSCSSISYFILISFNELISIRKTVNKCKLCGRFFIPNRSDTKYCDKKFPGSKNRTCQQEAKLRNQNKRIQSSEKDRKFRSISQMIRTKAVILEENKEQEEANIMFDYLKDLQRRNKEMKKKYKNYEISEHEYIRWLNSFYKRKFK